MKIIRKVIVLFIFWQSTVYSQSTCAELYNEIKQSECGSKVFKWLDGAEMTLGFSLSNSAIDLDRSSDNSPLSVQVASATPFPTFSLALPHSYLGSTGFAWSIGLDYMWNFGVEQRINRDGKEKEINLDTYFRTLNLMLTPSIAYVFGRDDKSKDWPYWASVGLGLGIGGGKVDGTTFLTEDKTESACYDAGTEYVNGNLPAADVRERCSILRYNEIGLGASLGLFLQLRIYSWIIAVNASAVGFSSRQYIFTSAQSSVSLKYAFEI